MPPRASASLYGPHKVLPGSCTQTTTPAVTRPWEDEPMIVVVAPGQGSQSPGFLEPWLADPAHRARLEALGEAAGLDLIAHGTVSDAETIRDTAIAQPLIVAASLLSAAALLEGRR